MPTQEARSIGFIVFIPAISTQQLLVLQYIFYQIFATTTISMQKQRSTGTNYDTFMHHEQVTNARGEPQHSSKEEWIPEPEIFITRNIYSSCMTGLYKI